MTASTIPLMFRGAARFYRVVGMQDETFYGLNIEVSLSQTGVAELTLAFACLGKPAAPSVFKIRSPAKYIVAYEAEPSGPPVVLRGYRLNKVVLPIGKNLSAFAASTHVETLIPQLKHWLDVTLDSAGIMPTFNDTAEVFHFFFGGEQPGAETFELDLPVLGADTPAPVFEFNPKKYGKGFATDPDTGEIDPPPTVKVVKVKKPKAPKYDSPPPTMPGEMTSDLDGTNHEDDNDD